MPKNKKAALCRQFPVYFAELALTAIMLAVYAAISKLTSAVILGASIGTVLAIGNNVGMLFKILKVVEEDNPQKGQLKMQYNYILRMVVLVVLLVFTLKFLKTDPVATALPIALMRVALLIGNLFGKPQKEETE